MDITLKQITLTHLSDHDFDGLYNQVIECACLVDNLMPCTHPQHDCMPGIKSANKDGLIVIEKPNSVTATEQIIKDIIKREGGYVNHPDDEGGATKYGITAPALVNYLGREVSIDDIKNLSKNAAYEIYYQQYYLRPKINELPQAFQEIILDMAVNHGANRAVKILQNTLSMLGYRTYVDGYIGNKTIDVLKRATSIFGAKHIINALVDQRVQYYERIVKHNNTQRVFLTGWVNRAESFRVDTKTA